MFRRPLVAWGCALAAVAALAAAIGLWPRAPAPTAPDAFAGSQNCRSCHEAFYQKWATSHHGLAMQPYTAALAQTQWTAPTNPVTIGAVHYTFLRESGVVREQGPAGRRDYPVTYVLGGKNVYYLLTPWERGKLQVLPVGYDVRKRCWYDVPGSAVQHFGADRASLALDWTDRLYTFNTACFGCHVSQLATRYSLTNDTYVTTWREPGISCETCHGPGAEHVRVCQRAPTNQPPKDLRIISTKTMTPAQRNDLCSPCHARMIPLTPQFTPGERFFDHFDLVTLEHTDFYPDGRDFGENYTLTSWRLSPCARAGRLDCLHCHTSSGRYRFTAAEANNACLPCHAARVQNAPAHTHHPAGSPGNRCVACHMPTTGFAGMQRSDHSMRPPMPEANLRFGSPSACLLCHREKTPAWTLEQISLWHPDRSYPAPTLYWAGLLAAARQGDWTRLPEMAAYLARTNREEEVASGLLRLLADCPLAEKRELLGRALVADPSPLVRAAAAEACRGPVPPELLTPLLRAVRDEYRVVRVRAARALAGMSRAELSEPDRAAVARATAELETTMRLRPDDAGSQYNLALYHMDCRDQTRALDAYETALRLRPDFLPALVNLALLRNELGQNDRAEQLLRRAAAAAPDNTAVHLNLGLLLGEQGRLAEAQAAYGQALRCDPSNAVAAYNLSVLVAPSNLAAAVSWADRARQCRPDEPRYAYTYAFYRLQGGDAAGAAQALRDLLQRRPDFESAWGLLVEALIRAGDRAGAAAACGQALQRPDLPPATRAELERRRAAL